MTYTLGDIDWHEFANDYELDEIPFAGENRALMTAETDVEIVFENRDTELYHEIFEGSGDNHLLFVYGEPEHVEDNDILSALHNGVHGQYGIGELVEVLKEDGIEPVAQADAEVFYANDVVVRANIDFDGSDHIFLAVTVTSRGDGYGGTLLRDGKEFDFDEFAREHGGKYAGFFYDIPRRVNEFSVRLPEADFEKYLKEA